jgi:hypothetical protein
MHHKYFILETFAPLIIWIGAISLTDINTVLGTIAGGASAWYAVAKLYNHYKTEKKK